MNKKIATSAILIAIIAASIATWFVHSQISELQSQNSDLQHQINELQDQNRDLQDKNDELQEQLDLLQKRIDFSPEVLITEFSSAYGWLNLVGVAISIDLKITISNIGISDVEGLTLEIKRLNVDDDPHNVTIRLGILHAGETTEFLYCYDLDWNVYVSEFHNRSLEAALKLGEVVLDARHFLPSQYL
jgi:FtsZ-binding cell division protein ZapB